MKNATFCIVLLMILTGCSRDGIYNHKQVEIPEDASLVTIANYKDSTITLAAGPQYDRSGFYRFWWGDHHREAWRAPVEFPVFDIQTYNGGLTPIKKGGSSQSLNLRLLDEDDRQYVLRSVDKDPAGVLPGLLQKTFVAAVMRDLTSTAHPYGALIVPDLAEAAGIYHTNPQYFYIPHDPALGEYLDDFGGMIALLEERPDEDWGDAHFFGNSTNLVSTQTMMENRFDDNDHKVDARMFARSRLFDMWIGDWSRREDQWRWATFEIDKGELFQPIPRDRDHAFFLMNSGVLGSLVPKIQPNLQNFTASIDDVQGLNKSGGRLDRTLLSELTLEDWLAIADSLQEVLTDEVIREAIKNWPDTIQKLSGSTFEQNLISRRGQLAEVAEEYYYHLSERPFVAGTDKHELFEIGRFEDSLVVTVHKTRKNGEVRKVIYQRVFYASETKGIDLYGLDGDDQFEVTGSAKNPIRINLYGGAGEDEYRTSDNNRQTHIYSIERYNKFETAARTKVHILKEPCIRCFDANGFLLNYEFD